ncbi:MAG: hypothetical protein K2Y29_06415 [Beijerinckiaceae bacterium]|nr:hypothetical protein [Beijerinckiaceae bacterium]
MIDDAGFDAIREQGVRRGFVTTNDLRSALPIDQMSADEIALVVVRLEEEGVAVELDDDLMGASRRREVTSQQAPAIDLPGAPQSRLDSTRRAQAPGLAQDAQASAEPVNEAAPEGLGGGVFVAAALAMIALGALILFFFFR